MVKHLIEVVKVGINRKIRVSEDGPLWPISTTQNNPKGTT